MEIEIVTFRAQVIGCSACGGDHIIVFTRAISSRIYSEDFPFVGFCLRISQSAVVRAKIVYPTGMTVHPVVELERIDASNDSK